MFLQRIRRQTSREGKSVTRKQRERQTKIEMEDDARGYDTRDMKKGWDICVWREDTLRVEEFLKFIEYHIRALFSSCSISKQQYFLFPYSDGNKNLGSLLKHKTGILSNVKQDEEEDEESSSRSTKVSGRWWWWWREDYGRKVRQEIHHDSQTL